ncbi:hypothetical protein [Bradyrhizobium sp. 18]|uniref:hypothetical protein n=1 Tax=Bradyrhizobium sp. 18 TaxID=2782657 RepID=UPI001FFB873D|nr:hypothetical protein [Bradyrhizobium sp. 18]MCK1506519.1 hypothetical protein [Bradyrhizobium sp. 18]
MIFYTPTGSMPILPDRREVLPDQQSGLLSGHIRFDESAASRQLKFAVEADFANYVRGQFGWRYHTT